MTDEPFDPEAFAAFCERPEIRDAAKHVMTAPEGIRALADALNQPEPNPADLWAVMSEHAPAAASDRNQRPEEPNA